MSSNSPSYVMLDRLNKPSLAYNRFESKQKELPEVLFLSGFRSDMNGIKATHIDHFCRQNDQTMTRFDYSGHGSSQGNFFEATIHDWLEDTLTMIDQVTKGPLILIGSSMGGWLMVLVALLRPERVKGLIGIAVAPDFTEELMWAGLSERQQQELKLQGIFHLPLGEGTYPMTLHFIEEGRKHLVLHKECIPVTCPVHLLHGMADRDVPWAFSERLLNKITSDDVTLTLFKHEGHRLNSPAALEWLLQHIKILNCTDKEMTN